jgi:hypothetical protein
MIYKPKQKEEVNMKKILVVGLMLVLAMAIPAMAWDIGYSISNSDFGVNTPNVQTNTDSFHAIGVLGSGSVGGENWAGGQAVTTHDIMFTPPVGFVANGNATQNFGEAIGGFNYSIQTGNKNFLWIVPPMAGAIAGTKGDVSQGSVDGSGIAAPLPKIGSAGSIASQNSAAGFIGADADLLIGKNKGPATGAFSGDSVVNGYTYSYSYRGMEGNTGYIGTVSGAGNSANTIISGSVGSDYAGGSGQTSGGSSITSQVGHGSTSGVYAGQFSYQGNGFGNVAGYSQSYGTTLPHGAVFGTSSGVSVNVN